MNTVSTDVPSAAAARSAVKYSLHSRQAQRADGNWVPMSDFAGEVLLIVNTASHCALAPQFQALQTLQHRYETRGFRVLAFPSADFMNQEFGEAQQAAQFCAVNYKTTFPVFSISSVRQPKPGSVFEFLTQRRHNGKSSAWVLWNFHKFLVGRDGKLLQHWLPIVAPTSSLITRPLEQALS